MSLLESWTTFPLLPIVDGVCGCGDPDCPTIGKHPACFYSEIVKGQSYPTPVGYGKGILTGARSGIFVVDLDSDDAIKAFDAMGPVPDTYTVRTARGAHLYFALEGRDIRNSGSRLYKGIDVRGEGGFVVAPGTLHKSGAVYTCIDDRTPAPAPAWLLERIAQISRTATPAGDNAPTPIELDTPEADRRLALAREYLRTTAPAISDGRGGATLLLVCTKLVRIWQLPLQKAKELIDEHYNQRCLPPWNDAEIWHKLENARDQVTIPEGCAPEGFDLSEYAKPAALTSMVADPTRRRPSKTHEYVFKPGQTVPETDRKKVTSCELSLTLSTQEEWAGVWQYDRFKDRIFAIDPPMPLDAEKEGFSDKDCAKIRQWFESHGVATTKIEIWDAAHISADVNAFDSYLESLPPGQETGISGKIATCALGNSDPTANDFLQKFLISAVRRAKHPGCRVDTVPVLYGAQGALKSTFVTVLFGEDFTRSQMPDLANKDASEALKGFKCIELSEMDRVMKAETSTVKEFLSRQVDDYRPAYGRGEVHRARRCVFIGTTNMAEFLQDSTGDRRFWPIEVLGRIDLAWLRANLRAIWADAVALEARGVAHWHEDEAPINEMRKTYAVLDAWHSQIEEACKGVEWIRSATKVCIEVLNIELKDVDWKKKTRVTDVLTSLGCKAESHKVEGKSVKEYRVPQHLRDATPSKDEDRRRNIFKSIGKLAANAR